MASKAYLSKSKIMSWQQCPRRLWLEVNQPELKVEDARMQAIFAIGHEVGEIARRLHPDGILIENQDDLSEAIRQTAVHLSSGERRPLFEATFQTDGVLVRADLLLPEGDGWHLVEVKSSTSVKPYHLQDVAIQAFVIAQSDIRLNDLSVQVINNQFVYPGDGHYEDRGEGGLFTVRSVKAEIAALGGDVVAAWITGARQTLAGDIPERTENCTMPFECPFLGHCYGSDAEFPVSSLPGINFEKAAKLRAAGYHDIRDIPAGVLTGREQERVRAITVAGEAQLLPQAAADLDVLPYPRYYLDFETIGFAVPIWVGTRPYQNIPFQWSCHVEDGQGRLTHREFLDLSGTDPSRQVAESLVAALGDEGPVFAYNASFEGVAIKGLAERFPDLAEALLAIAARLVDLLLITRRNYYHPDMHGSWSIKAVLPTLAPDLDYSNLEDVQHGLQAQQAYLEAIAADTPAERKVALRQALSSYCERDTEAMVRLARFLSDVHY